MNKDESRSRRRLEPYRAKRSAQRTPEPFGGDARVRPRLFCVQKHAARRLHYDFRLEWGGTLWSWAVPKGPCLDPKVNRLAVQVEDHPIDYADFEGVIPSGEYGAGAVIVWDLGMWVPLDDPDQMDATGKLHFELRGYKLHGIWLLLRTGGKEWLLRKKTDAWSTAAPPPFGEESVLSGLSLEELRDGNDRVQRTQAELVTLGAGRRALNVDTIDLTLAETAEAPFSSPDWIFELKYDGYRVLAARQSGMAKLRSRNGHDLSANFPDLVRSLRRLPYDDIVLDGEMVILDAAGKPDFQALQKRSKMRHRLDIGRATVEQPATLFVFDLLGFAGLDLRGLPLLERKRHLQPLLPRAGPLRFADHVAEHGSAFFDQVAALGLEGVLAKRADSKYVGRRTPQWLKVVVEHHGDFVVCGYTRPKGSRTGFGALHLGLYENEALVYAGRVGTGFDDEQLRSLHALLDPLRQDDCPCTGNISADAEHVWVRPEAVAEVRFKEVTRDGLLRAPVFVRMRDDKLARECIRDAATRPRGDDASDSDADALEPAEVETESAAEKSGESDRAASGATATREDPRPRKPPLQHAVAHATPQPFSFTNLDKIFWPEDGLTKGAMIDYYRKVAPRLLPYLHDRPLVLTRYPDGIHGKSFYQKNAPEFVPEWIRRVRVWSDSSEREIEYFVCDSEEALLYIANMGAIPLHVWPSRVQSLQHPDWCILDLDPKTAPFAHVVTLARAIRALCEDIGLPSFVKTTGSTGLHVLIPLGGQCTFDQSRQLGQLIARHIESQHARIATTLRNPALRAGRVYLDYLQNRHGQLLVAPYSLRPLPGAPASAPLTWKEVDDQLGPRQFTLRNLPARLARQRRDPLLPVLDAKPNLVAALAVLAQRLDDRGKDRA